MHVKGKEQVSKHQVRIVDPCALQSVLRAVVDRAGSHGKAARALGIRQTTFTRLLNGTTNKRIRFDTYCSIKEGLSGRPIPDMEELFVLLELFEGSVLTEEGSLVEAHYENWLDTEFGRLRPKVQSVLLDLFSHQDYERLFRSFLERVTGRPEPPKPEDKRLWVAICRAVEPLADSEATWGVERSWEELDEAAELSRYLKAALKREEIILNRERDRARFNVCAVPEEFKAWLAGVDEDPDPYPSREQAEELLALLEDEKKIELD